MKINKKNIDERFAGVPDSKRSHIYYAGLIIEFLDQNFVATRKWLPDLYKVQPGTPVDNDDFRAQAREHRLKMSELYDLYLRWREVKDYTSEIESKFKFGVIVRHLRLYKNGWEFDVHRVGTAQIWHVGPLALIKDLPEVSRRKVEPATIERGSVEIDMAMPPQYDESVERVHKASMDFLDRQWKEAHNWEHTRNWVIAEFEIEE